MTTVHKAARRDGGRSHADYCNGDYHEGGPQCGRIAGIAVDVVVTEVILARLTPPRLGAFRTALKDARAGERSEHYRRKLERDRVRPRAEHSLDVTKTSSPQRRRDAEGYGFASRRYVYPHHHQEWR